MKTRNAHCGLTAATPSSSPTRSGVAGSTSARAGAHRRPAFLRRALALLLSLTLGLSASRGLGAPLTPLVGSPYNSGGNSQVATLSRDGNFLFVTNQSTGIKVMTVAANGVPTLFGTFTTTPASGTTGVVTSPDGKYLYATTLGNTVNVHSVAANGTLAQIQAATLGTASAAENGITYVRTSGGDFVYVNNNAAPNTVTGFPVQANGTLGSPTSTATGGNAGAGYFASPRMMCKCLATQRIFVLNSSSNTVSVFNVAANGALTLVGSPFAIGGTSSGAIAVDSPATHLYAALSNGSVTKFNIDATTGALTSAGTFATGVGNPDGLTVSPGGTYLLAADPGSGGRIAVLTAANMLPVAGSPIVSSVATSVEFNKAGTIIYVGNTSGVAAYTFFAPDPSGPSNTAPVANAGTNQSVNELDPVTLHGTASDPDNNPLTYAWTQLLPGAYPVTLTGANTLTPTFTAPALNLGGAPGGTTLTFQLIVNDGTVNSAPSTVSVNVTNVNHAPLADAGPDQTVPEGAPVGLNGANSADTDGDTLTYDWIQIDGPSVVLSATNVASPGFTAPDVGPAGAALEFMLTVNDGYGGVKSDNVVVNVTYTNRPPVADAGAAQTVNEGDTATLAGTASDPDGNPLSITWSQVSGPAVTLANNGGLTPSFTAPLVDRFAADVVLRLSVDDGFGGTASSDVSIHIANINHAPVADAGLLQSVPEGTPVGLAGSGLDQDTEEQPLLTYAWVQTFGPAVILTGANTTTPSFTAPLVTAGGDPNAKVKLKFQLTVTDPNNASASAEPDRSSRVPATTPSDTVSTFASKATSDRRRRPDRPSRPGRVVGLEHRAPGDEDVDTRIRGEPDRARRDPAVDLDLDRQPARVDLGPQATHLVEHLGDERLAAPTGVHTHHEHQVDLVEEGQQLLHRRRRVGHDPDAHPEVAHAPD